MQAWQGRTAETPHEQVVQEKFVPRLQAAVQALQMAPDAPEATKDSSAAFVPKLAALEAIAADLRMLVPGPAVALTDFAPSLCSLPRDASLPVPGGHGASPQVSCSRIQEFKMYSFLRTSILSSS
jgi:hypothetical protein